MASSLDLSPNVLEAEARRAAPTHTDTGRRLRILHVVRQYAPAVGGLETYVAMLAREQRAAGHEPMVLTLDRVFHGDGRRLPAQEMVDGIRVERIRWFGSPRYPLAPGALRRLGRADLVHVHGVDPFVDGLSMTRLIHRKPMVLSTHGGFFHTGFARRFKKLYFNTVTRTALVGMHAVLSSSVQDHEAFVRLAGGKTVLVENGVDLDRFRGLAAPGRKRIVYFGRLAPNKGIERLLEWFAALNAHDPAWGLIVAGRPSGTSPDALRLATDRLGLGEHVDILPSPTDEAIAAAISCSSVFACASSYEGFGIAALEAAAAGLYPVLSDIPPFRETCRRLRFGTLVDFDRPSDPVVFLAAFERFQADRPDAREIARALAPFEWRNVAHRIETVYRSALGDGVAHIGRVDIRIAQREAALERVLEAVLGREATVIAFCNAHTVNLARREPALSAVLKDAIIYNDGVGVGMAARLLYGRAFPANLNGTDLVPQLLGRLPAGMRIFLVGSAAGIAERAGAAFAARFPDIEVAGTHHGFFGAEEEAALTARIVASRADLVLVGMGQPQQELWAARHVAALDCPVLCVGGLLDFAAQAVPRAPAVFRRLGLEWMFRLMMEPRRLARRYLIGNIGFLVGVIAQWVTNRRASS